MPEPGTAAKGWEMSMSTQQLIVHVTIHRPSGHAVVTGPKDGIWNSLAIEAGAKRWNQEWGGWVLENLHQVADLCTLADMHNAIYKEHDWTPQTLANRKAARRERTWKGRRG